MSASACDGAETKEIDEAKALYNQGLKLKIQGYTYQKIHDISSKDGYT
jgi:hypothetical protein